MIYFFASASKVDCTLKQSFSMLPSSAFLINVHFLKNISTHWYGYRHWHPL